MQPEEDRTNTPLQALVTLNDAVYIDIARYFALRMKKNGGKDVNNQIAQGYQWLMYKSIPDTKLKILGNLYRTALNDYKKHPDQARQLLGGQQTDLHPETAALVVVANAMLNLDEAVTKN